MAKVDELSELQAKHKAAAAVLAEAETAVLDLAEVIDETEKDVLQRQRNLKAFRGDDPKRRQRLLDNPEFANFNPAAEEQAVHKLLSALKEKQAAMKDAQVNLDKIRSAERSAFYSLARFRHKAAALEALKL